MDDKAAYWASVGLSAVALLLMVTNVALVNCNRNLQTEVAERQNMINNGMKMGQFNGNLVQALADISIKNDDKEIRDLLASQGITVKPKAAVDSDNKSKE